MVTILVAFGIVGVTGWIFSTVLRRSGVPVVAESDDDGEEAVDAALGSVLLAGEAEGQGAHHAHAAVHHASHDHGGFDGGHGGFDHGGHDHGGFDGGGHDSD